MSSSSVLRHLRPVTKNLASVTTSWDFHALTHKLFNLFGLPSTIAASQDRPQTSSDHIAISPVQPAAVWISRVTVAPLHKPLMESVASLCACALKSVATVACCAACGVYARRQGCLGSEFKPSGAWLNFSRNGNPV